MIVSIHQPNFVPWLPYFEKMKRCDVFVVMGHCQFEKNGYQNRFFYEGKWRTMSTARGLDLIIEKKYISPSKDWQKIKDSLPHKNFQLELFDDCVSGSLFETNFEIIKKIAGFLKIETQIIKDFSTNLTGTARLVEICKQLGASKYLSGPSGKNYLDLKLFERENIEVIFHENVGESIGILDKLEV
jgi:hypothetical protein